MSAAKHTPGPWDEVVHFVDEIAPHFSPTEQGIYEVVAANEDINRLRIAGEHAEAQGVAAANARLIAAAPALLEALEKMLEVYEALMPGLRHIAVQDYALLNDAPMAARQAIAAARGEVSE